MNCRGLLRIIGLLLLVAGWGFTDDLTGPAEAPFCSNRPVSAVATFEDANLEEAVRAALSAGPQRGSHLRVAANADELVRGERRDREPVGDLESHEPDDAQDIRQLDHRYQRTQWAHQPDGHPVDRQQLHH